jgi:hypothetical protein
MSDDTKPNTENPITNHTDEGQTTNQVFATVTDIGTGKIYTDQTGKFPILSSRDNKYLFVLYNYDSNAIMAEPIKPRTQGELTRAYKKLFDQLEKRGLRPQVQLLDNECSQSMKDLMAELNLQWQLTPAGIHRRSAAERGIHTFKNHLHAGLASTDDDFPLHLWCRLVHQAQLTLNLLHNSRLNPRLSAEAQLNGQFDYNKTPIAPPGIRVVIHEKSTKQGTWAPHGALGFYIGPAPDHYQCWRIYVPKTQSERIGDTVEFSPQHGHMSTLTSAALVTSAALELTETIKKLNTTKGPKNTFEPINEPTTKALVRLAEIFHQAAGNHQSHSPLVPTPLSQKNTQLLKVATPLSPRVATPLSWRNPQSPRVATPPPMRHRYPTRHRMMALQGLLQTETKRLTTITGTHPDPFRSRSLESLLNKETQRKATAAPALDDPVFDLDELEAFANAIVDPDTGESLEYRHLIKNPKTRDTWLSAAANNEFGQLMTGLKRGIHGTRTMHFIYKHQVPKGRKVTYARFCCNYRPQKDELNRCHITVGGDRLDYPGEVATKTANMTTIKCLLNSVLSRTKARFMTGDISLFTSTPPWSAQNICVSLSISSRMKSSRNTTPPNT